MGTVAWHCAREGLETEKPVPMQDEAPTDVDPLRICTWPPGAPPKLPVDTFTLTGVDWLTTACAGGLVTLVPVAAFVTVTASGLEVLALKLLSPL